ncbi:helix-turn-helix domain-containing protein [Algihabitans albus]|uniref:helix-turn-helix domain-containing protein n=1 Tax=Algihabitans albus TaxID=2164067 RepID=UPI000E5D54D3|nr:helix-turn-helix transcriptional regulator [Algihabitans albus]
MIDWAREIRRHRESAGLLQGELAEDLGVTQATVSRWESRRQRPDLASQRRLRRLIWSSVLSSDALLLHTVTQSPASSSLCDRQGRLLAASHGIVASFGFRLSPGERLEFDMEQVSPSGYRMFQVAREAGLFDGEIASFAFRGVVQARNQPLVCDEIWYPVQLNDGEVLMRADVQLREAESEGELRALASMPTPAITAMDDLKRPGTGIDDSLGDRV